MNGPKWQHRGKDTGVVYHAGVHVGSRYTTVWEEKYKGKKGSSREMGGHIYNNKKLEDDIQFFSILFGIVVIFDD